MSALVLLGALVVGVAGPPAPGVADDAALDRWRPSAPWATSAVIGIARPWGALDVRTDWVDLRWAARAAALSLGAARTSTATVDDGTTWLGVEVRSPRAGLRVAVVRRVTQVHDHGSTARLTADASVRWSSSAGTLAAGVVTPATRTSRLRSFLVAETRVGVLDLVVLRRDRRHERATDVVVSARLALAALLGTGLRLEAHDTLWSVDLAGDHWGFAWGRVVQGPREGASAVRVEWRP